MRVGRFLLLAIGTGGTGRADAPPMPPVQNERICSSDHIVCATIDRERHVTTVRRGNATLWTMASAPPAAVVARGGDVLIEQFRPGGLLEMSDGPDTVVLIIRHKGAVLRRIRLNEVVVHPDRLPKSVSHRRWSRVDHLAGNDYVIDTEEGKRVSIALSDGTITVHDLPGGASDTWYCRYAQPTTTGPCATSRHSQST